MTTLRFDTERGRAAVWLLRETGLDEHFKLAWRADGWLMVDESWPGWSSGEFVLVNLVVALAGHGSMFELRDLKALDPPTRQAAVLAIGAAYGVFADPALYATTVAAS